jgi:hypothetical protein
MGQPATAPAGAAPRAPCARPAQPRAQPVTLALPRPRAAPRRRFNAQILELRAQLALVEYAELSASEAGDQKLREWFLLPAVREPLAALPDLGSVEYPLHNSPAYRLRPAMPPRVKNQVRGGGGGGAECWGGRRRQVAGRGGRALGRACSGADAVRVLGVHSLACCRWLRRRLELRRRRQRAQQRRRAAARPAPMRPPTACLPARR